MRKHLIGLALLVAVAAPSVWAAEDEPRNIQVLNNVIEQLEKSYGLECKAGRNPGAFLNPLICGIGSQCLGIVRFKCRDAQGNKLFKVRAAFIYLDRSPSPVELRKVVIKAID